MPGQGRLGDKAHVPVDAHGCPACPHTAIGPAISGSADVFVNGRPALRVQDTGIHAACCGPNIWTAVAGSATVFINGRPAHRMSDATQHCSGRGKLIEGSPDVIVGDNSRGGGGGDGGGGPPPPHQQVTWIALELNSEDGQPMAGQTYRITTPDGKVKQGQLDKEGRVRVDDIKVGSCEITFPDLDGGDWRPT